MLSETALTKITLKVTNALPKLLGISAATTLGDDLFGLEVCVDMPLLKRCVGATQWLVYITDGPLFKLRDGATPLRIKILDDVSCDNSSFFEIFFEF